MSKRARLDAKFRKELDAVSPQYRSREHALMATARRFAGLQTKRRKLRADLRELDRQIKITKAELKTLVNERPAEDWQETGRASKILGALAGDK